MVRSRENLLGAYAFLIGVVIAIALGLFSGDSLEQASSFFYSVLVVIGIFVGFMNVSDKNSSTFLIASLTLVVVGALATSPLMFIARANVVVNALRNVLISLMVLFVPVTIIVALKTVFAMAKV